MKILAVASGGGHWKELMLLKSVFNNNSVKYVTTLDGLPQEENIDNFNIIMESNKTKKFALIVSFFQMLKVYLLFRPNVVITTGASVGVFAVVLGNMFNAKTIWVDSIANANKLSLSGELAQKVADITLTQWEHLADGDKVIYRGAIF
jgi:UDP-N-acetylglucosamine:LPS N-acetylglucosamine transferase